MKSSRKYRPRSLQFEPLEAREVMAAGITASISGSGVLTVTGTDSDDLINFRQIGKNISIVGVNGSWTETKVKSIVVDLKGGNDTVSINSWTNGGTKTLAEAVTVKAGAGNEKVQLANNQEVNFSGAPNALTVSAAGVASMNGVVLNFGSSIVPSYKSGVLTITGTNSGESIKFLQANGWIGIQGRTEWWAASTVTSIVVNLQEGNDSVSFASLSNGGNQALAAAITVNSGQGSQTVRLANGFDVNLSGWGHQLKVSTSGAATLDGQTLNFTEDIQTSFANGLLTITGKGSADNIKLLQSNGWIGIQGRTAWWAASTINGIVVNLRGGDDALSLDSLANSGNESFSAPFTINSGDGNETVRLADGHDVNFSGTGHQLTVSATGTATLDGQVLDFDNPNPPAPTPKPPVNTLPASYTTNEDTALSLAGISIADLDAAATTMTVTLNVNSGKLTATSSSGVTVVGSGSGTITLTGTLANLNTFLSSAAPIFNPVANANGTVTLTMTTTDGGNLTDVDTRTITVTPVNDPPVAVNDTFTTNEDTAVSTTVLSNDSDPDGNPLTITKINGTSIVAGGTAVAVTNGTVSLNAAGTQLTFTPTANFNGSVSYTYTISDGQGGTSTATVSGTVTPVNDPPVAVNDTFTTNEDTAVSTTVLSNDSDVDGNPLTITKVNGTAIVAGGAAVAVTNGTVSLNAAGTQLTFTPTANFNGSVSYTYTISDGQGGTSTATVSGTVTPVNDLPVAVNDTFTTNEDTAVSTTVLSNDSDVDGNPLTITKVNGTSIIAGGTAVAVTNGTVSLNAAGTQLTFTPAANFNGSVSYTYTISNGQGGTSTATVSGTVTPVNDPPVAVNDTFTTNEDTAVSTTVLSNDSDVDGNPLTITKVNGTSIIAGGAAVAVTNGTVSLNAAGTQLTFTPTANFNGSVSYTYTISDGQGGTSTATVSGTVTPVNDPPVAVNDTFTTNEDTAVSTTVLSNDSDVDGNPLTITKVNGTAIVAGGAAVAVTNGTVSLNAAGTQLTFTPTANFNGSVSYTYTISDGQGGTSTATVSGTVTPVNDLPVAVNDTFTTNEDTAVSTTVLSNDSDVDGNPLTITKVNGTSIIAGGTAVAVTNGTVSLNAAGTQLTFTPAANFNGSVSYTYTISNGQGGTSTATVSGTVTPVNDPPVAVNDTFTTNEDTAVSTTVLSNDSDVDGNPLTITKVNGTSIIAGGAAVAVTNGTVSLNAAGTQLTFTPTANFNGSVSYTYTISDGQGGTSTATVSGTVTPVNDPPVAVNDTFTTNEDTAVSTTVLSNDSDVDGNPLTITKVNGTAIVAGGAAVAVTNGTVSLNAAGTQLTFTPTANFNGSVSYTYTISDGQGGTSTATVSGTVTPVDDPPVGTNWFDTNIQDAALRTLGHNLYLDGIIDRSDILALLRNTEDGGVVDGTELADLRAIVTNTTLVGTQAHLLKLTSYIVNGSVANANYQGTTLGNLAAGSAYSQLDKLINKWFLGLDRPTAGGTYLQFAGQLFVGGTTYDDIHQGAVGDCYFVMSLAEVAFRNPSMISNMFIVNGDGTYTVRFYNPSGQSEYVTVDSFLPTDGNGRLIYSSRGALYTNTANELWVALAEKAYAQLNELGWSRVGFAASGQNSYAGIDSGYVYAAMSHVTGLSTVAFTMTAGSNSFSAFVTAFNAGKMIGFATYASPPTSGVVGNHAYAVVGYNATNQTVTLFNPWGTEYGLLTMTWSQITANFMYYDRTA